MMNSKTIPFSVRLSQEDADFIAGLEIPDAKTPSDKLRAIVAETRQRHQGSRDYASALRFAREMLSPVLEAVRGAERYHKSHSELLFYYGEWIAESFAHFFSSSESKSGLGEEVDSLIDLEESVAKRTFQLLEWCLRMSVTECSPTYDPSLMRKKLQPLQDIFRVISREAGDEEEKRNRSV